MILKKFDSYFGWLWPGGFKTFGTKYKLKKSWPHFAAGILWLLGGPFFSAILALTIIGIPFAITLFLLWFLSLFAAEITIAAWFGSKIIQFKKDGLLERFLVIIIGFFIILLLGLIPIFGWLFLTYIWLAMLGIIIKNFIQ